MKKNNNVKKRGRQVTVPALPDVSGEDLDSHMGAPSLKWRYVASEAADLERAGRYSAARDCWQRAALLVGNSVDRDWFESRMQWCAHQVYRGAQG